MVPRSVVVLATSSPVAALLPAGWLPQTWWPLALAAATVCLLVAALAGLAGHAAALATGRKRTRGEKSHGTVRPTAAGHTSADHAALPAPPRDPDRTLVLGLIGTHDLADGNPAVLAHVEQVLRRRGVVPFTVRPGTAFDPSTQDAVETEALERGIDRPAKRVAVGPTEAVGERASVAVAGPGEALPSDPTPTAGQVVRVVRTGWHDDHTVYRASEVVVWGT